MSNLSEFTQYVLSTELGAEYMVNKTNAAPALRAHRLGQMHTNLFLVINHGDSRKGGVWGARGPLGPGGFIQTRHQEPLTQDRKVGQGVWMK